MRKVTMWSLVLSLLLALFVSPVVAQVLRPAGRQADELLVKMRPGNSETALERLPERVRGRVMRRFEHVGWRRVKLPPGANLDEALARYQQMPEVAAVEPNYIYTISATPNDPGFRYLWGMGKIQAQSAWDTAIGDPTVVVAVLDTGVYYSHQDLQANMWRNTGEIAGNRIDDDHNGYVDDIYGINGITGSGDPLDDHSHGTHVAGTIGAVGNNGTGVVGVNWQVKIMGLKFMGSNGSGNTADAVECYNYAIAMKKRGVNLRAVNNSWGGSGYSQSLKDAIDTAASLGITSVCAAGNNGKNIDSSPQYPAAYASVGIIGVAASDQYDRQASYSNYGSHSVLLAAPGSSIYSTLNRSTSYGYKSGTSMAAPHVAGAVALLCAKNNALSVAEIKTVLANSVDKLSAWSGRVASGGRLNVARALQLIGGGATPEPPPTVDGYQPDLQVSVSGAFVGDNVYSTGHDQAVTQAVAPGTAAVYQLQVQNDGTTADSFTLTAPAGGNGWTVRYYNAASGGMDITSQITGAGWHTTMLTPGSRASVRVEIMPDAGLTAGATRDLLVTGRSAADTGKTDAVKMSTSVAAAKLSAVELTVNPGSPQAVGTPITLTASANAPADFKFQVGTRRWYLTRWTTLSNYSSTSSVTWTPTSRGTYSLAVLARTPGSSASYEVYKIVYFSVQ
jgi:subtilisin family serine protease